MRDNEIIKALECCADESYENCNECPYSIDTVSCERMKLLEDSLYLINRQNAEIERLKEWENLLKAEKHSLIKSEVIKEFANKLKKHSRKMQSSDFSGDFWDAAVLVEDIDNLVEELESENNG